MSVRSTTLLAAFLGTTSVASGGEFNEELAKRQEQQLRAQEETERVANRLGSLLQVMTYYDLGQSERRVMLRDAATTLSRLGREEMGQVLTKLEEAVKAPDQDAAVAKERDAYEKHRVVMAELRQLMIKYDNLRSLEQAAARLDHLGRTQLGYHISSDNIAQDGNRRRKSYIDAPEELADFQADLTADIGLLSDLMKQLEPRLGEDHLARLREANALPRIDRLASRLPEAERYLRSKNARAASPVQREAAVELQAIAQALREQMGRLSTLRAARDRIEEALEKQEKVRDDTMTKPDRQEQDRRDYYQHIGDEQARVQHDVRDAKNLLAKETPDIAGELEQSEREMKQAESHLRAMDARRAIDPEESAEQRLRESRDKLDELIEQAERERDDPLAAVEKAAEEVDRLLAEQTEARDKTAKAEAEGKPEDAKAVAPKQGELAKRTEAATESPKVATPEAKEALADAAEAMKDAADALEKPDAGEALPKQNEAIDALKKAKEKLEEQAAEIAKRREDIEKLEDALGKLDRVIEKQDEVTDKADQLAKDAEAGEANKPEDGQSPKPEDVAKEQGELTPEAKELGKEVADNSPKAAEQIEAGAEKMEAAKEGLENEKPAEAAENAEKAGDELKGAREELAKDLNDLKAQEIADQAAMKENPNTPATAAQQVAKAIEQSQEAQQAAQDAAQQAQQAADQLQKPQDGDPMAQPMGEPGEQPMGNQPPADLAQLQKQVADEAEAKKLEGAEDAQRAAEALQQGDLPEAIQQQEQALGKLEQAAKTEAEAQANQQPMGGEPMPGEGQPMPGEGQPMGGEGQPMKGEGQPSAPSAAELAQAQKKLLEATRSLRQSQQANDSAQAALAQAQAQAPQAVQSPLSQAQQQLGMAGQQLAQGSPSAAQQSQQQAASSLGQALDALNAAASAMGLPTAQPGQSQQAMATPPNGQNPSQGQQPGQGQPGQGQPGQGQPGQGQPGQGQPGQGQPGQGQPGQGQGKPGQPSPGSEKGEGDGQRNPDGKLSGLASKFNGQKGDGAFIHLPPQERDRIRESLNIRKPAEFGTMLDQYYRNIATGKPATKVVPKGDDR